jgi:hypothetical protein
MDDGQYKDLKELIRENTESIAHLNRSMRGFNGDVGLMGRFSMLSAEVDRLIVDVKAGFSQCPSCKGSYEHSRRESDKEKSKEFGTWSWFRDAYLDKSMGSVMTVVLTVIAMRIMEIVISSPPP